MSDLVPGVVEELAPGIRRVVAPNPSLMTGSGTNSYLIGGQDVTVIDPGPDDAGHLQLLAEAGEGRVRYVAVTHTHPDHAPGAASLAQLTGAMLLGFGPRDGFEPEAALADGDVLAGDDFRLRAFHTPGHASNHLCYLEERTGVLFSGDHVMGGSTVVIAPLDGDMAAYLQSLERLRELGDQLRSIAPGHGSLMDEPEAVLDDYIAHRLAREGAILASLRARGDATVTELVADVYVDVAPALHPVASYSVWAHLRKLRGEGSARSSSPDELGAVWSAVASAG